MSAYDRAMAAGRAFNRRYRLAMAALAAGVALASCQTVNESCQHDCYANGEQTRGGNSPTTNPTATVPLLP